LNPDQQTPEEQYEAPCAEDIDTSDGPVSAAAMVTQGSPPPDLVRE
jgi:hypothetical protein